MKNPLHKRIKSEVRTDAGRYIALFVFLALMIAFVSGFLIADKSMKTAYDESFDKYNVEDGHFSLTSKATANFIDDIENEGALIYEMFYKDFTTSKNHTVRVYAARDEVNKACLMDGELPTDSDEIAIDRLYAENNSIKIGDSINLDGTTFRVSGTVALSDYSALFKSNTDMMFDANKFTVAVVSEEAFDKLSDDNLVYCYSWINEDKSLSDDDKKSLSDDIKEKIAGEALLTDFVMQADNQAITFTGDDMGSDKAMMTWLLYVVIVILAFVFAVTTRSKIEQEAKAIGTLRASGYKRGELLIHYLEMPIIVTVIAAALGNILGYTLMKNMIVNLYYHSYSLTTYSTIWSSEAFIKSTLIPCLIILAINILVLSRALRLSPLQFLRNDLRRHKSKDVMTLSKLSFMGRFRIRIIFQNKGTYITLLVGIVLASFLLLFGLIMSPLLSNFKDVVTESKIADYQYVLKAGVPVDNSSAEKYSVAALKNETRDGEEITVYGISEGSDYLEDLKLPDKENEVIVSDGYMEKYHLKVGDKIKLCKAYDSDTYEFTIKGHYDYAATLGVFMSRDCFNDIFDKEKGSFNGYFSNEKLDIDESLVASTITVDDLTTIANQLDDSMGNMFLFICGFAVILYIILMYLLAKLIIDKNASSISMVKILGYNSREIAKLYNRATAVVVIVSLAIALPICLTLFKQIYYIFMQEMNGWLTYYVAPWIYGALIGIGILCYFIVHVILSKRISRISMATALKDME